MNCEQSELWMMDAFEGSLTAPDRRLLMAHLDTCAKCHAEWEGLNALERIFANPPLVYPAPGFVDRVEARLARSDAQRRTLIGGLILLGAAAALCLLAVPSLLNGRSPIEAYGEFLGSVYDLAAGGILFSYRLVAAVWLTLDALAESADVSLVSALTYAVGAVLAVAAWRRAWASQQMSVQPMRNGR